MSEPAPEGAVDGTVEATAPEVDTAAEDQQAEELLAGVMQQEDPDELKKQVEHWRKTAQRHEKSARENSASAKRLRELEDANKSEVQKAVEAREAAERERDAVRAEHTRSVAVAARGLDPDAADFLGDGTEEEINARADQLSEFIAKEAAKLVEQNSQQNGTRAPGGARGRPVETMRPGAVPAGQVATSANDMFRQLLTGNRD